MRGPRVHRVCWGQEEKKVRRDKESRDQLGPRAHKEMRGQEARKDSKVWPVQLAQKVRQGMSVLKDMILLYSAL